MVSIDLDMFVPCDAACRMSGWLSAVAHPPFFLGSSAASIVAGLFDPELDMVAVVIILVIIRW
jgi:hypothetical protein